MYFGRCFVSWKMRPKYSPTTPRNRKFNPKRKSVSTIIEVQPGATKPIILLMINMIPVKKLSAEIRLPAKMAARIGNMEKEKIRSAVSLSIFFKL